MSDAYKCLACGYTTGLDKSYHLHIAQCPDYLQIQATQEEHLRSARKRKHEEAGDPSITLAHLRNLRLRLHAGQKVRF